MKYYNFNPKCLNNCYKYTIVAYEIVSFQDKYDYKQNIFKLLKIMQYNWNSSKLC